MGGIIMAGILIGLIVLLGVLDTITVWIFGSTIGLIIGALISTFILVKLFQADQTIVCSVWAIAVLLSWMLVLDQLGIEINFPEWTWLGVQHG